MNRFFLILCCLFLFPAAGFAAGSSSLTIDLAQKNVDITTVFAGTVITLYGVIEGDGDVVVVVRGPEKNIVVRKKQPVLGAWMNRTFVEFNGVPGFYHVMGTKTLSDILPEEILQQNVLGLESLKNALQPEKKTEDSKLKSFKEALIRNKRAEKLYFAATDSIEFIDENRFFKAQLYLPANVPVGLYNVETYFVQNGQVVDRKKQTMNVAQTGLSRDIRVFSVNHSFIYGVLCVMLAVFSGWFSNRVRRR